MKSLSMDGKFEVIEVAGKSIAPKFSLLELSDSFSFLFLYYNGHAVILIDQLS